jgi:hypothetical protein
MNEEGLFELVKEKIGKPIGCYYCKPDDGIRHYPIWRWFILDNGEWQPISKQNVKGLILDVLPGRYCQMRYVGILMQWFKAMSYSEEFKAIISTLDL